MILAGLCLAVIGAADVVRQAGHRVVRWTALAAIAVAALVTAVLCGEPVSALVACVVAAGWIWALPVGDPPRLAGWPVLVLGLVCVAAVAFLPRDTATFALVPGGTVAAGRVILLCGIALFLVESSNAIVRIALSARSAHPGGESRPAAPRPVPLPDAAREADAPDAEAPDRTVAPLPSIPELRGGRLIGPLERLLIFALTLTQAYALVAAFVAAKGIVRFPEISRDSAEGNRAEYFLIGSMVSWVTALAAAGLFWWSGT